MPVQPGGVNGRSSGADTRTTMRSVLASTSTREYAGLREVLRHVVARHLRVDERDLAEAAVVDLLSLDAVGRGEGGSVGEVVEARSAQVRRRRVDCHADEHHQDHCEADEQQRGLAVLARPSLGPSHDRSSRNDP